MKHASLKVKFAFWCWNRIKFFEVLQLCVVVDDFLLLRGRPVNFGIKPQGKITS